MKRIDRLIRAADSLSADERAAMVSALRSAYNLEQGSARMVARLEDLALAMERSGRRKKSDRRTDLARRKLVGARLPMEQADRCAKCAELEGVSLYRFVVRAMGAACENAEKAAALRRGVSAR